MEILAQGKRKYVLGLQWDEAESKPAMQAKRAIAGGRGIYDVQRVKGGKGVVGILKSAAAPKGKLYSAAHAIAAQGVDGVFGIPHGGRAWYVAITGGRIMPGTDVCLEFDEAVTAMASLRDALGLPLCWAGSEPLPLHDCGTFDVSALDSAKIKPVQRVGDSQLVGGILLTCVLGGVAYGGWHIKQERDAAEQAAMLPADQQEQLRESYLATMRQLMAAVPGNTGWVVDAFERAKAAYPVSVGGWMLDGFACQPGRCVGTYTGQVARLVAPAVDAFGAGNIALTEGGKKMIVTVVLPVESAVWTDANTQTPPRWERPLVDVAGRLPLHFAAVVDGEPVSAPVPAAPVGGMQQVMRDSIAVRSDHIDSTVLGALAHHFGQDGFVASNLSVSGAAWRVEFVRHGGAM